MLYNFLKILHILSASFLLLGFASSLYTWKTTSHWTNEDHLHLQTKTMMVIIPLALFQLASGFTIISLKHYEINTLWVRGSIVGFIILICSWLTFLFFSSLQHYKKIEKIAIVICIMTVLSMIFFMANKIV